MIKKILRNERRVKRRRRVRGRIFGTIGRPRLSVFRSLNHIYAQIIDDEHGNTLVSASSLEQKIVQSKMQCAKEVGKILAVKALEKKIDTVVFDRNGYLYHGKVKELAESARAQGLKF
ncbi:MAG: 50S ribosomal protein L18 [Candidatus Improbicoccus pseudotrichonymphae]|uniref:Large ribosomal subunit protein uL18 n=1 Tax=Candidatus Improbicoccus pseudotrichonymphae TaxID=3033792 RepID=A0AA48HXM4_9FIRM|nr:MAG: 50S ribosomal protein L18 [Candidatus Improbicoccus pseudotrichonymphae]